MKKIEDIVKELPPKLRQEVRRYVRSLVNKQGQARTASPSQRHAPKPRRPLKLKWRGALRHLRDKYTSVQLQHKTLDWWHD